jgi:methylenetetrahydrofolate reductase (NADPH)
VGSELVLGAMLTGSNPQNLRSMLEDSRTRKITFWVIGQVDFVSLTDNPGGNPHIRPEVLGQDLLFRERDVVINMSCKDYNRNGVESRLWALGSQGFSNVLALSGDYSIGGFRGQGQPVFDIDSVGLLELMRQMNDGLPNQM